MNVPKGMTHGRAIALSENLENEHHIPGGFVTGTVLPSRGDGWVENTWENRHLSGSVIQLRRRNNTHYHEFLPLDNALLQAEQVDLQISEEIDRLAGWYNHTGEREYGEIDDIRRSHKQLADWLTLTNEDKAEIASVFTGIADARAKARNPFNLTVGSIAYRARELKDRTGRYNPGAVRAMILRMEKDMAARHGELAQTITVNSLRGNRLQHDWLFHENQVVAQCHAIMERLLARQNENDLYALRYMAPSVRFRVRPFNLLAHEIAGTGNTIRDEQVVSNALAALQFERFKNYLLSPFGGITAPPKKRPGTYVPPEQEPIHEALARRVVALESMSAPGATGRLVSRLIPLGEAVLQASHQRDKERAAKIAQSFKWLVNYHCLPERDPEVQTWYRHQLR